MAETDTPEGLAPGEMATLALTTEAVSMLNRVAQNRGVSPSEAVMSMTAQFGAGRDAGPGQ